MKLQPSFTQSYIPILVLFFLTISSCNVVSYSFTGAPISAKNISIAFFPNKATLINSALSQGFTEALRDKFVNQTKLQLVDQNGELQLSGEIVEYKTEPKAIQENETAALNRLTITVNVRFVNTLNETESFEQRFSSYQDYDAAQNFSSVEPELVNAISTRIIQDIFNKAVVNW